MNALPTGNNLRKKVSMESTCMFSDRDEETMVHLMRNCPRTSSIWLSSPLGIRSKGDIKGTYWIGWQNLQVLYQERVLIY